VIRMSLTMRATRWLCSAALLTSSIGLSTTPAVAQDPTPPPPEQPDGGDGSPDSPQNDPPDSAEGQGDEMPPAEEPENANPEGNPPPPTPAPQRTPPGPAVPKPAVPAPGNAAPTPANPNAPAAPAETPAPVAHPFVAMDIAVDGAAAGRLVIELFPDVAPQTVANFLAYVDSGFYNDTIFHRIVQDYIIQGGGYTALDVPKREGLRPPIPNEARPTQRHLRGTIAAARVHRDLGSATSQFFINLTDNRRLDRHNYAVFGKVVEGMDLIDKIVETTQVETSPLEPAFQTRPVRPPQLTRVIRLPDGYKPNPSADSGVSAMPPAQAAPVPATPAPSLPGEEAAVPAPPATPSAPEVRPRDAGVSRPAVSPREQPSPPTPRSVRPRRNRPNAGAAPARSSPRAEREAEGMPAPEEVDPDAAARERQRRSLRPRPTSEPLPARSDPS
jgi:peptidyl-prolyl cis-trans isomerase A (cyclophilin A)